MVIPQKIIIQKVVVEQRWKVQPNVVPKTNKKADRFFKERGIKYQFIDMKEKGMSKGEFNSVAQANDGLENVPN